MYSAKISQAISRNYLYSDLSSNPPPFSGSMTSPMEGKVIATSDESLSPKSIQIKPIHPFRSIIQRFWQTDFSASLLRTGF
jgi:hypothetical protein